jgi:hypothetical protein
MATGNADLGGDYRLSRDDGARLDVHGSAWEAALELAYLYGWHPAGTETPQTDAWRNSRPSSAGPALWDAQDYFSRQLQHVGQRDARALAQALDRALHQIQDEGPAATRVHARASPMPSRATARAEGLSVSRRTAIGRLAAFANAGGFTIAGSR